MNKLIDPFISDLRWGRLTEMSQLNEVMYGYKYKRMKRWMYGWMNVSAVCWWVCSAVVCVPTQAGWGDAGGRGDGQRLAGVHSTAAAQRLGRVPLRGGQWHRLPQPRPPHPRPRWVTGRAAASPHTSLNPIQSHQRHTFCLLDMRLLHSLIKLSHGFIGLTYRYEYESIFIGLTYRYEYVSTFIAVLDEEERHFMNQALSALKTSVSDDEQNRCCVYVYDSFFDQHNLNKTCQRGSSALPSVLLEKLCYCLRDTLFVSSSWNLLKDFLFFFLSLENLKQAD